MHGEEKAREEMTSLTSSKHVDAILSTPPYGLSSLNVPLTREKRINFNLIFSLLQEAEKILQLLLPKR